MLKRKYLPALVMITALVGTGPSLASGPLGVSVGDDATDTDHGVSATSTSEVRIIITGEVGHIEWGCTGVSASAVAHGGNSATNGSNSLHHLLSIDDTIWSGCIGWSELPFSMVPNHTPAWEFIADHNNNITAGDADMVDGELTGVVLRVEDKLTLPTGGLCSFDLVGVIDAVLDEAGQQLMVGGHTLELANVSGCFGAWTDGDPVYLDVTLDITIDSPSSGPVLIS